MSTVLIFHGFFFFLLLFSPVLDCSIISWFYVTEQTQVHVAARKHLFKKIPSFCYCIDLYWGTLFFSGALQTSCSPLSTQLVNVVPWVVTYHMSHSRVSCEIISKPEPDSQYPKHACSSMVVSLVTPIFNWLIDWLMNW